MGVAVYELQHHIGLDNTLCPLTTVSESQAIELLAPMVAQIRQEVREELRQVRLHPVTAFLPNFST